MRLAGLASTWNSSSSHSSSRSKANKSGTVRAPRKTERGRCPPSTAWTKNPRGSPRGGCRCGAVKHPLCSSNPSRLGEPTTQSGALLRRGGAHGSAAGRSLQRRIAAPSSKLPWRGNKRKRRLCVGDKKVAWANGSTVFHPTKHPN